MGHLGICHEAVKATVDLVLAAEPMTSSARGIDELLGGKAMGDPPRHRRAARVDRWHGRPRRTGAGGRWRRSTACVAKLVIDWLGLRDEQWKAGVSLW